MAPLIRDKLPELRAWCEGKPEVARLWVFGSAARDEMTEQSDVDLLIEYLPDVQLGLEFFGHALDLERVMGRQVDLADVPMIHPYYAKDVWQDRVKLFERLDAPTPLRRPDWGDHPYYQRDRQAESAHA